MDAQFSSELALEDRIEGCVVDIIRADRHELKCVSCIAHNLKRLHDEVAKLIILA